MIKFMQAIYLFLVLMMLTSTCYTASIHHSYHQQLRMQIYSKPNYSGQVQTIRTSQDHVGAPCFNLSSKRIGSYDISDPNVKITFYRSMDCKGVPTAKDSKIENKGHVMIKSKSVSLVRLKPVYFVN